MAREITPQRARLGTRLRELRATRFRSASELGRALGWQQSRVSKLERGAQLPSSGDLDAWVRVTGAEPAVRAELDELLTAARVTYSVWSDVYRSRGIAARQAQIGTAEAEAAVIREYQPAMMPGIVQTTAYAHDMLSIPGGVVLTGATTDSINELIAARVKRQELLYQRGCRFQIVLGQAALQTRFGTVDTLLGQLDRLVMLSGLASMDLRVLPEDVPSPIMPLAGFSLHDDGTLHVETLTGEHRIDNPEEVTAHTKAFEQLRDTALADSDAVALIQQVATGLREADI